MFLTVIVIMIVINYFTNDVCVLRRSSPNSTKRSLNSPNNSKSKTSTEKGTGVDLDYRVTSTYNPVTALLVKLEKLQTESTCRIVSALDATSIHEGGSPVKKRAPVPPSESAVSSSAHKHAASARPGGARSQAHREVVIAPSNEEGAPTDVPMHETTNSSKVVSTRGGGLLARRVVRRKNAAEEEMSDGIAVRLRRPPVPTQANAIKVAAVRYPVTYANLSGNDRSQKAALKIQVSHNPYGILRYVAMYTDCCPVPLRVCLLCLLCLYFHFHFRHL